MTISAEKAIQLAAAYNYTPTLALVTSDLSTYTATVNAATDLFTATGHDYVDGTPVLFSNSGGALFGGIEANTTYFVRDVATDTFKVSDSVGGVAVDVTSVGSGTNTVTEQAIADVESSYTDASIVWDVMVRHEVASYQGDARKSFSFGALSQELSTGIIRLAEVVPAIIPSTGSISCKYAVLLRGANLTRGDGTGSVTSIRDLGNLVISIQGHGFNYSANFP